MKKKILRLLPVLALAFALVPVWGTAAWAGIAHAHNEITFDQFMPTDGNISYSSNVANVFLDSDTQLSANIYVPKNKTLNLCLNGNMLKGTGTGSVITCAGTLNIYDCGNTSHKWVADSNGLWTINESASGTEGIDYFTTTGGCITNGNGSTNGGGILIASGSVTLNAGNIIGCKANKGGGVFVDNGTFTMAGGCIAGCTASADGAGAGVFLYGENVQFNMDGGKITYCTSAKNGGGLAVFDTGSTVVKLSGNAEISHCLAANNGGGVYLKENTKFELDGSAKISECKANAHGAGVYVGGGTGEFTIKAGTITDCKATNNGGGVFANNGSSLTIQGGTISKCEAVSGGGIYLNGSTSTMSAGIISECKASANGAGVFVWGTFKMSGSAQISKCKATGNGGGAFVGGNENNCLEMIDSASIDQCEAAVGGGVYAENASKFKMGKAPGSSLTTLKSTPAVALTGCKASSNGGGVFVGTGSEFTMYEGTISACEASVHGGGVFVGHNGEAEMNGGTISGCKAAIGGGVYVDGGSFTQNDGEISQCIASDMGGGVYLWGEYYMGGSAKISGCSATNKAGGMYIAQEVSNKLTVSENANVTGNTVGSDAQNVYLTNEVTIAVDSPSSDMKIGITHMTAPVPGSPIVITDRNGTNDYSGYFTSDSANRAIIDEVVEGHTLKSVSGPQHVVALRSHEHAWTFVIDPADKSGATIKAICGDKLVSCPFEDMSLTINAPENLKDDGTDKVAHFGEATSFIGGELPAISYMYKEKADGTYKATTDLSKAGYYKASFTVGDGEDAVTASVEYVIGDNQPLPDTGDNTPFVLVMGLIATAALCLAVSRKRIA